MLRTSLPTARRSRSTLVSHSSSNSFQLEGVLKVITDIERFDSGFFKRATIVTTREMYPQDIKIEWLNNKCSMIDGYCAGDNVVVHFNIRGREWDGKHFVNLVGWRMQSVEKKSGFPAQDASEDDSLQRMSADDSFVEQGNMDNKSIPF